ncbi:homeodomain-only protein-like [Haliotis cracherodii]|uniref:homeodomain-only protein-like n=1 Tax=Haliotis cracherodii TaxID=6455 RepID=UPI0039E76088
MTTNVMYGDMAGIQAHLSPSHLLPKIGSEQHKKLEANFRQNRNPSDLDVTLIAAEVGLDEEQVKRWFRHRLACWRQQQGLPANSGSVND